MDPFSCPTSILGRTSAPSPYLWSQSLQMVLLTPRHNLYHLHHSLAAQTSTRLFNKYYGMPLTRLWAGPQGAFPCARILMSPKDPSNVPSTWDIPFSTRRSPVTVMNVWLSDASYVPSIGLRRTRRSLPWRVYMFLGTQGQGHGKWSGQHAMEKVECNTFLWTDLWVDQMDWTLWSISSLIKWN